MLNAFCTFLLFYERFITGSGNDTSDTGIGRKTSVLHGATGSPQTTDLRHAGSVLQIAVLSIL